MLLSLVLLTAFFFFRSKSLAAVDAQLGEERAVSRQLHEDAVAQEERERATQIAREEQAFEQKLQDEALISGALASQRHAEEWQRRLTHDPELANTPMEKTLVRMQQIGEDPHLSARAALEQVALMAAPKRSRVEVSPSGDRFQIRVAFPMSSVSANESGAVTKHQTGESMRSEIADLSAKVMKLVFAYCGSRGIEKVSVTCNHAMRRASLPESASDWERQQLLDRAPVVFGRLYRVSLDRERALQIPDWRRVSVAQLRALMEVEFDELSTLQIRGTSVTPQPDPTGPLEF